MEETAPDYTSPNMFQEIWSKKNVIIKSGALALGFFFLQFLYQYYFLLPGNIEYSLLTGACILIQRTNIFIDNNFNKVYKLNSIR